MANGKQVQNYFMRLDLFKISFPYFSPLVIQLGCYLYAIT